MMNCLNCGKQHRTWNTKAKCIFKGAVWISGEGQWALFSCKRPRGEYAVSLWPTRDQAEQECKALDSYCCGGGCRQHHLVKQLF